jgi:thioredoxin
MNFKKDVLDKSRDIPVLVKFSAEWCAPCKYLQPILEVNAKERSDYEMVYVDTDKERSLANQYNIRSIPTLILFNISKPIATLTGSVSKVQLNKWLDQELPVPFEVK